MKMKMKILQLNYCLVVAAVIRPRTNAKSKDYHVICYYSSWAWLRKGDAKFVPENVIQSSCTHVLYAYAGLDPKTLLIKSNDIWTDISNSKSFKVFQLAIQKQTKNNEMQVSNSMYQMSDL